jgi:pimeloyl-ACP methyl ester carboxylesterase
MLLIKNIYFLSYCVFSQAFVNYLSIPKINTLSTNRKNPTMILGKLTQQFNIRNTIIDMNKDIYSFLKEEKNFNTRKTILNFPGLQNVTHIDHLDITFVNNLEENSITKLQKKTLLYLPGLDMSAVSFYPNFLSMRSEYNIHTLVSGFNTNATFDDLNFYISKYITDTIKTNDLIIIGESFGALPAICITNKLQNKKRIKLILINPATSYHKSIWYDKVNNQETTFSNSIILDVITHGPSIIEIFKSVDYLKRRFPKESKYHTYAYFYVFINIFNISPTYIKHRVDNWIDYGLKMIEQNNEISKIKCKTLLLAGENDDFLPSSEEVKYLSTKIKDSKYFIIPNCSHYISINYCDLHQLIKKNF